MQCAKCGKDNPSDQIYCINCGMQLINIRPDEDNKKKRKKMSKNAKLAIALIGIPILVLLAFLMILYILGTTA